MLFLLHAVYNGGLVFEDDSPLVPIKSTPLQLHVSELNDNAGHLDAAAAEQNAEYAGHMLGFLRSQGGLDDDMDGQGCTRELIRLLRFYDTNALSIRDDVAARVIAKGIYLSTSLFNHSCAPNCVATFEGDSVTIRATCLVEEGAELCISYIDTALPRATRQAQLWRHWRFACECDRCESTEARAAEEVVHGIFCPYTGCRNRLVVPPNEEDESLPSEDLRPSALAVSSVPEIDQSFLPSFVGYAGERAGYEYREGRHGSGYYQAEDEYGEAVVERGDALKMHTCLGCHRKGADVHMQRALIATAERHKFFYVHKQPFMDPRVAAQQTAEQLRQVANLELSCLHPFHPSVVETLRVAYRMHNILQDHSKSIQLLRVIAVRDETIYGVVSPQTAHTSWLLADAFLKRAATDPAPTYSYSKELSVEDASQAASWAEKALQIASVLYGRNHELTYAIHVTLDMALFRVEHDEREKEMAVEQEMKLLHLNAPPSEGHGAFEGTWAPAAESSKVQHLVEFGEHPVDSGADAKSLGDDNGVAANIHLQCPKCATVFSLTPGTRIKACTSCGHFCTERDLFIDPATTGATNDPFGEVLAGIMGDYADSVPFIHAAGDMLPVKPRPFSSTEGLPGLRSSTAFMAFYDANMRTAIGKIAVQHQREWAPCEICTHPRSTKQCSGCKAVRYCSLRCAKDDFQGHKVRCKELGARRLSSLAAIEEARGARAQPPPY